MCTIQNKALPVKCLNMNAVSKVVVLVQKTRGHYRHHYNVNEKSRFKNARMIREFGAF